MTAHQAKKVGVEDLKAFRDRFNIPVSDTEIDAVPFLKPREDSDELRYLLEHRAKLGGTLPASFWKSSMMGVTMTSWRIWRTPR